MSPHSVASGHSFARGPGGASESIPCPTQGRREVQLILGTWPDLLSFPQGWTPPHRAPDGSLSLLGAFQEGD